MPVQVEFEWQETEDTVVFALRIPRLSKLKRSAVRTVISPAYIRVSAPPYFFEADLLGEIDEKRSVSTVSKDQLFLRLPKKVPGIWKTFSAADDPRLTKEKLLTRRQASLEVYEENQKKRRQQLTELKHEKHRKAQEEQWRMDRETREWLEAQKELEKAKALREVYSSDFLEKADHREFTETDELPNDPADADCADSPTAAAACRKIPVVDDSSSDDECLSLRLKDDAETPAEAGTPEMRHTAADRHLQSLRAEEEVGQALQRTCNPDTENVPPCSDGTRRLEEGEPLQKKTIQLSFTARRHHRLPARGDRIPPFPKDATHAIPPKNKSDKRVSHEEDPEWLKQKGDKLLRNGDMRSAIEAYSAALRIASNARCFANRAQCHLLLGDLDKVRCCTGIRFRHPFLLSWNR